MKSKIYKLILSLIIFPLVSCGNTNNPEKSKKGLVTSRVELINRISTANDGETILVGDIDFSNVETMANATTRVKLTKSVTIKSGSKDNATFTNGSFDLIGPKVTGENINVTFENIDFKGIIEHSNVTDDSFYYKNADDMEPWNQQYASNFKGNIKATYSNCTFENYLGEYGAAMWARYADYSYNETLALYYGNNF